MDRRLPGLRSLSVAARLWLGVLAMMPAFSTSVGDGIVYAVFF
ncbi:hypothetical protein SALB1_1333 [Salinisphaera sp. LB1]|nr:hypothetical protein SALB1_1333 [Salinisphaera sp. LB1]